MAGIKVGEGYVEVKVREDLGSDVKDAESKASPQAEKTGDSLGKTIAKGLGGAFAGLKLGEMITGAVDQSAVTANLQAKLSGSSKVVAAQAGKAAGKVFADGYGENLEEVNDSITAINDNLGGLAKYSQSQTQSMSKDALTIANVYGQDVNEVIRTAGGLMKNGLAKNADDAFDIISSGMQNGLNNSDELLDSLNEYAEPLSAIGLDGPAALGAFKRSLDAGNFSIDKAGDAINEFATRSIDGSKSTVGAYKSLGLNADDMMARISKGGKSARDATSEVIQRLGGMKDSVEQDATGVALFGSMWEDAGKKTILALDPAKGSIDGVKGSTDKMADANQSAANRVETMQRKIDAWKNSLIQTDGPLGSVTTVLGTMGPEGIAAGAGVITASKGLGEMAVSGGKATASAGKWAGGMAKAAGSSIASSARAGAAATVQGAKTAAGWAVGAAGAVRSSAMMAGTAAKNVAVSTAAVVKNGAIWTANAAKVGAAAVVQAATKVPMLASAAATGVATAAQWAFNSAVLANPITWIIVGIVALIAIIVLLIANWDSVVKFITGAWSKFMAWIKPALDAVGAWWSGLWTNVKNFVVGVWTAFTAWVSARWVAFVGGIRSIGSGLASWWNSMWTGIRNFVTGIWTNIRNAASGPFNAIVGVVKGVVGGVKDWFNNLVGWVTGLPGRIGSAVSGMWDGIKSGFRAVVNGVIDMWNGLSFTVPGIEVFGHKVGGFTLSTPNLPHFAQGTNYFGGGPALVGENGPEVVNLPKGSSVTDAQGTERWRSDGGGDTYVTNNTITINEAEDPLGSGGRVDAILRKWSKK